MILLILLLIAWGVCAEPNPCCSDENIVHNQKCLSNPNKIMLEHCKHSFYADPEVDEVQVLPNGNLLVDENLLLKQE